MMLCVSNVIIFPYQKENILRRKWYVLNLVCFGSGTATFDKRGTIESEIEERCQRLAEGQALCCQGGVSFTHISHFILISELSEIGSTENKT